MSVWTVGIDPGKTGAIAVLDSYGTLAEIHDMPYEGGEVVGVHLADIFDATLSGFADPSHAITVWVEKVGAMPKQGLATTWKFAQGYGTILGVCAAVGVRTKRVTPPVWKRAMKVGTDKGTSRRLACELWPSWSNSFRRVKDDGRAEAALIAEYGRRQELRS